MKIALVMFALFFALSSCSEKKTKLESPPLSDYWKPAVGKYIIYRLDSTVTTNFGIGLTVHSYRVKDLVDAEITDALGRKAYRIIRTITDTNGIAPYRGNATMMTVPVGGDWIELVDNNLRYMRLRHPVLEGFKWYGHAFINTSTTASTLSLSYLEGWNYTYENVAKPYSVAGKQFENTITVKQIDESPAGPLSDMVYQTRKYGKEVYAKGVGLVFKEFLYWVHQPPNSGHATSYYEDGSYGIKLQVLEYN